MIKLAMIRIAEKLRGRETRMLLQVHDELVFEVKANDAEAAIPVVREVMEAASLPAVQLKVPIHVDAKAADNWEAAH